MKPCEWSKTFAMVVIKCKLFLSTEIMIHTPKLHYKPSQPAGGKWHLSVKAGLQTFLGRTRRRPETTSNKHVL